MPVRSLRPALATLAVASLVTGSALLVATPAYAASFTVTSGADSGAGTLRQAILDANAASGADTITFDPAVSLISVSNELPEITDHLTIDGPGAAALTIEDAAAITEGIWSLNANPGFTIAIDGLTIDGFDYGLDFSNTTLTLTDVSVTNTNNVGLYAYNGQTSISASHFDDNGGLGFAFDARGSHSTQLTDVTASRNGGGGNYYSGDDTSTATFTRLTATGNSGGNNLSVEAYATATVTITTATLTDNTTADGLNVQAYDDATVTANGVIATGNDGYGLSGGTGSTNGGTISVTDSSFDSNTFGAIALVIDFGTLTLTRVSADSTNAATATLITGSGATVSIVGSSFDDNTGGNFGGGAVMSLNDGSALSMSSTSLSGNSAGGSGGGLLLQLGESTATLTSVTLDDNTTVDQGGGLLLSMDGTTSAFSMEASSVSGNEAAAGGGAALYVGNSTLTGGAKFTTTTFDDNHALADLGGGILLGAQNLNVSTADPVVTIERSTISNNSATGGGGGLAATIISTLGSSGDTAIVNTTISGNSSAVAGGGLWFGSSNLADAALITSSTVAGNSAPQGGGIYAESSSLMLYLLHSVVANNGVEDIALDTAGLESDWSLVETPDAATSTALTAGAGNRSGVDPRLGALADNGGPTRTMLPLTGSPLLDAGNPAIAGAPALDQRGFARIAGSAIDIGAVEVQITLAATGSDAGAPLAGGLLLLVGGILLLFVRRRRSA